jgi:hypothetical protein
MEESNMSIINNLRKHWTAATPEQRRAGRVWYTEARAMVRAMAMEHATTSATVAGVIAATSPRLHWVRNVAVSRGVLAGERVTGVFRANLDKAKRIAAGAKPLAVLGGNKVRAFYRALLGDCRAAVVDVWILRASGLAPEARLERGGLYERVVAALVKLAAQLRIGAAELQATIWVVARGRAS